MYRLLLLILLGLFSCLGSALRAQALEEEEDPVVEETFYTFRTVNGHTVQTLWKGYMMVDISHRFGGTIDEGIQELFGLDISADIRLGFAYGITDNLTVGFGRSRVDKIYDGYVKYRFVQQKYGGWPITATLFASAAITSDEFNEDEAEFLEFRHRVSYDVEVLLASRISKMFSVQVSPTLVHHNLTQFQNEKNTTFALGTALEVRFNEKLSATVEYIPVLNQSGIADGTRHDALGFSFNIRSSKKHEYQLQFSNTEALIGQQYIPYTRDNFFNSGIHFGFHITRNFGL